MINTTNEAIATDDDAALKAALKKELYKHLISEINRVRWAVGKQLADPEAPLPPEPAIDRPAESRIDRLCTLLELSELERNLLILCAGIELDEYLLESCAALCEKEKIESINLSLAQKIFDLSDVDHCDISMPLFSWKIVSIYSGRLVRKELQIDAWVLQYLLGNDYIPPDYVGTLEPEIFDEWLEVIPSSYGDRAKQLCTYWLDKRSRNHNVQLCGPDPIANRQIAAIASDKIGWELYRIDLDGLSSLDPSALRTWLIWWYRRALLQMHILLVTYNDPSQLDPRQQKALSEIKKMLPIPLILNGTERLSHLTLRAIEVKPISPAEQKQIWQTLLKGNAEPGILETGIGPLVSQFNLDATSIHSICDRARNWLQLEDSEEPTDLLALLWDDCRVQARSSLEGLAERIESKTTWNELVLNDEATDVLHQVIATARNRNKVFSKWQMGGNTRRGMGLTSLFFGPPGTGKTTAAEIIAHVLGLDLYRVDLSQISDKYIGETEKKLKKIFDEAEKSGALLLFDEADALIGKRTDVKDSKDRYANQSVSYLLQRMEAYTGIAILTTNLPNAIDTAFMRRIRFQVRFEYPTLEQRFEIWKRQFPAEAPTDGLSFQRLAQLNVPRAIIRNIALGGAFLAADEEAPQGKEVPIQMRHLLQSARAECIKQGRPITDEEIRGWV